MILAAVTTERTPQLDLPEDRAAWGILGTNALVLAVAMFGGGGLLMMMWTYWLQSVIIGLYSRRRILALRRFSTQGFKINDRAVDPTVVTKRYTANFFLLHYGFFHFVYAIFLLTFSALGGESGMVPVTIEGTGEVRNFELGQLHWADPLWILALGFGFWQSHGASHREHVAADLRGTTSIGTLMALPYARIIPMHLTIIFGIWMGGGALLLFGTLKTAADVAMHKVEHRLLQQGASRLPRG